MSAKKQTATTPYKSRVEADKDILTKEDAARAANKDTSKLLDKKKLEEYINSAVEEAGRLWDDVKNTSKTIRAFNGWEDKKKISYFRDDLGYKNFMNDYPITSRCMIIAGQYSVNAFKKFLTKCKVTVHPPDSRREKGYMEDQWLRRQADYVQYLWIDYQKKHYNAREAHDVWQNAYTTLKDEIDDFRETHDEIKKNIEEEKKKHKVEILREVLARLQSAQQKLPKEKEAELLEMLRQARAAPAAVKTDEDIAREMFNPDTGIKIIKHSDPICVDTQGRVLNDGFGGGGLGGVLGGEKKE